MPTAWSARLPAARLPATGLESARLPSDTGEAPVLWFCLTLVVAILFALLVGVLIGAIVRRIGRRWPPAVEAARRGRLPLRLLLVLIAIRQVVASTTVLGDSQETVLTILGLAIIAVCGWLLAVFAFVMQDLTLARFPIDVVDNRRARRVRTQVILLRRLTVAAIITLVIASMLLSLPGARQFGATILASAGVLGIVAGLAAQSSLSNLFAGLQLAFTDAIRVDDVVVVEKEWGRIEEITLTYVVVHLWDDRRMILPSTYFTTTPFQNWTRKESAVLGAVELDVDWSVPLAPLRSALDRALAASTIWDGRVGILQVTDAVGSFVRLRVLVSGIDGPTVFDLRCEVREALVDYLQRAHPESLPRIRVDGAPAVRRGGDADQSPGDDEPGAVRLELQPVERESESTGTQGLFTGSAEAAERARGFTRPTVPGPVAGTGTGPGTGIGPAPGPGPGPGPGESGRA
jgi:small-conductance mechanosensitive channel